VGIEQAACHARESSEGPCVAVLEGQEAVRAAHCEDGPSQPWLGVARPWAEGAGGTIEGAIGPGEDQRHLP
jgi:hypothetical protein